MPADAVFFGSCQLQMRLLIQVEQAFDLLKRLKRLEIVTISEVRILISNR